MKIVLIFLILNIFVFKNLYASNLEHESNFFDINISSQNISEDKIKEINKVKYISFEIILNNILNKDNLKKLKRKINLKNEINFVIQNINIEDEFILKNNYSAKIRVNFDYKEIISLLRANKINYSDLKSPNILFIVIEDKSISNLGLSKQNSFYQKFSVKKSGLLSFVYPDLSPNDRFILPYNKIKINSLNDLFKISEKYKSSFIVIIKIYSDNVNKYFDLDFYSTEKNKIIQSYEFNIDLKSSYRNKIISLVDQWWKNLYIIDNSIINTKLCSIKNSNIHELYFIISKINTISQVKSLKLLSINLGQNLYELVYYGDPEILSLKLSNHDIFNNFDYENKCILSLIS